MFCRLCSLVNEALHKRPGRACQSEIEKALYWFWGKCILHKFSHARIEWTTKWSQFFAIHGVFGHNYCMSRLQHPDVVYVRVGITHTKSYVGSTEKGMIEREANRRRKFAARARLKDTEPAFLWWAKTNSYWEYCPIVLQLHAQPSDAQREERRIHSVRKPELVAPWIWKHVGRPT